MSPGATEADERFRPTSGRVTGPLTIVVAAAIAMVGILERSSGFPEWVVAAALLAGVLAWASIIRPALSIRGETLVMRNMFDTVHIPLAAVEEMVVRQVLAVRVGDARYISTVVGRSWRKTMTAHRRAGMRAAAGEHTTELPYADFVEERLRRRIDDARSRAGLRPGSPEQAHLSSAVLREPAWLPICVAGAAAVALVLAILLG